MSWLTESKQIQQDLRVSYTFDRGNLIVGGYYGEDETYADNHYHFYEDLAPLDVFVALGVVPIVANNEYTQVRKSKALYAHGSWEVSDKLTLTAGLRYTDDKFIYKDAQAYLEYSVWGQVIDLDGSNGPVGGMVNTADDLTAQTSPNFEHLLAGLVNFPISTVPAAPLGTIGDPIRKEGSSSKVTGTIILDYKIDGDTMVYGSFSRGYRAATINGQAYLSEAQVSFVEPEVLDAWELGFKSRFADNRVQLNGAAFYYDYSENQMLNIIGIVGLLQNAPSSEIKGFELEMAAMATENLTLNMNLGYQDAVYKELTLTDGNQMPVALDGNQMMNAPKWNISASLDWTVMENEKGALVFTPSANFSSKQYLSPFNELAGNQKLVQGNYTLVNAQMAWETEDYTVRAWGRNIFDKTYMVYGIDIRAGFDVDYFMRGAPASYGLDVTFRF